MIINDSKKTKKGSYHRVNISHKITARVSIYKIHKAHRLVALHYSKISDINK